MRIFSNCTDLVGHISILLTISDSICFDTNSCKRKFWKLFKCKQPVNFIYRITSLASEWDLWMILWEKNALFSLFLKAERRSTKLCFLEGSSLLLKKFPLESFLFAFIKYLPLLPVQQLGLNLVFLLLHLSLLFNICTCVYVCILTYIKHILSNMHILYTHICVYLYIIKFYHKKQWHLQELNLKNGKTGFLIKSLHVVFLSSSALIWIPSSPESHAPSIASSLPSHCAILYQQEQSNQPLECS